MARALAVACLLGIGIVAAAYRLGRRAGMRRTIPSRPIFQLVDHRLRCLGHDRTRVARELGPPLGVPAWAWDELLAPRRPLVRRRAAARSQRSEGGR